MAQGESHISSDHLWSIHLDIVMFPFLVQEVMAYSDQTAELLEQTLSTSNPSSAHIFHREDLLWLKGMREAKEGAVAGLLVVWSKQQLLAGRLYQTA